MRSYLEFGLGLTHVIPLLVYICGYVIILLTFAYRIEIGIYYVVILIPLQNLQDYMIKYPLGKDFLDLLLLAILLKWIIARRDGTKDLLLGTPLNIALLVLGLWTFFGLWLGTFRLGLPWPLSFETQRLAEWKNFMTMPLVYFLVVNNVKRLKQMKFILLLMALTLLIMGRSFYTNFLGGDAYREADRIRGTFSYLGPNELATFYAQYSIIMVALMFLDDAKWRRFLFGVVAFINYYCVAFLYSRGGYVATLVSWTWQGIIKNRKTLVPLVVMVAFFWQMVLPKAVVERIEITQQEYGFDRSVQERVGLWKQGLEAFARHPIIGIGFNTIPYYGFTDGITPLIRRSLHNGYLEVLVELGLVGLLLLLVIFGMAARAGWKLYRLATDGFSKGLGIGFVGCVLAALVANFFSQNWVYMNVMGYFWVCLGLIVRRTLCLQKEGTNGEGNIEEDRHERS